MVNSGRCLHEPWLALFAIEFGFHAWVVHIAGVDNIAADALSQNKMSPFFTQTPLAQGQPTAIPESLRAMFLLQQPDWLFSEWRQYCRNFLQRAWFWGACPWTISPGPPSCWCPSRLPRRTHFGCAAMSTAWVGMKGCTIQTLGDGTAPCTWCASRSPENLWPRFQPHW